MAFVLLEWVLSIMKGKRMKVCKWILCAVLLGAVAFTAEFDEDELERLERSVKVGGITDMDVDNELDEEIIRLKFYSYQDQDDEYIFRVRVTIEFEDKEDNLYFAQYARLQGATHEDYTGEDNWEFDFDTSMLKRPKVTAYTVEYGILHDGEFVVLELQTDDVDTPEEILERATERIDKVEARHRYNYYDGSEVVQSDWN
jgi:hypothetical protein